MRLPRKPLNWLLIAAAVLVFPPLGLAGWKHLYPTVTGDGWQSRVYADEIERVSALIRDTDGVLLASQEYLHGKGTVLRLTADGKRTAIVSGLYKPDGFARYRGGIAIGQENDGKALLWLHEGKTEPLFTGNSIEGVASDGGLLYAIEDRDDGRLLRYDAATGKVEVLREHLQQAEAIAVCPDGRLLYTEKKKGHVKQWQARGEDNTLVGGLNEPGFLLCDAKGVWITEDATHMARLLLLKPDGELETVLSHLRSAQTILPEGHGHYLLAEQGRNRILEIAPADDAS